MWPRAHRTCPAPRHCRHCRFGNGNLATHRRTPRRSPDVSPAPAARRRGPHRQKTPSPMRADRPRLQAALHPSPGSGCSTSANSSVNVDACAPRLAAEKSNSANTNDARVRPCAARPTGGVVLPPPPRIDECLVRLDDPLKHLLGAAVTRIDTGMVAASQPAVGPLDVGGRSPPAERRG